MKRKILSAFLLSLICISKMQAQHKITIRLDGIDDLARKEGIYITGSFQKWQPGDEKWKILPDAGGNYEVILDGIKAGLLEFKFTRGDWKTLESTADGRLVAPRSIIVKKDTVLQCHIDGWRDQFPASTASAQVHMLDSAFYIPQLNATRPVRIYLPKDYANSKQKYPVLYMHDGQDLFDEATSEGRIGPLEWGVDEAIDAAKNKCIVVAVDHHSDKKIRVKEYFTLPNSAYPQVEGKQYLEFIVETLKPYVDRNYRTLPDSRHTAMAGSSMGGLLTFYAGLYYPNVFGFLGVLSPSVWLDERNIYKELEQLKPDPKIKNQHYYFYAGGNENRLKPDSSFVRMHDDVNAASGMLKERQNVSLKIAVNPSGRHGAWYWRMAFPVFYDWLSTQWQ